MKYFAVFLLLMISTPGYTQLKVADIFTDHMVLQRDAPLRLWGTATPGIPVEIQWRNKTYTTQVQQDATWFLEAESLALNKVPQDLVLKQGSQQVKLKNILVGDVWVLLGQSNMEWPMQSEAHFDQEHPQASNDMLRFYNPTYIGKNIYGQPYTEEQNRSLQQNNMFSGAWQKSDTLSIRTMSAVGYYFGKTITEQQDVPIGLINLSIGGAPIETFIDTATLASSGFKDKTATEWLDNPHLPIWIRERGKENLGHGNLNHAFRPGFVYQTGIAPIVKLPVSGILWYQGESNAQEMERVQEYQQLQTVMVDDFRKKWQAPELPFYYVQLSSIDTLHYQSQLWPEFRNEQLKSLEAIPHTGMAVSLDHGAKNDVHPRNKKVIGQRLARWALRDVYKANLEVSGPLPSSAQFGRDGIVISFNHSSELKTSDGKPLRGFSIDGNPVAARIENDKVILKTNIRPDFVTYAWDPFSEANLVNKEQLPAPTFRIEVQP